MFGDSDENFPTKLNVACMRLILSVIYNPTPLMCVESCSIQVEGSTRYSLWHTHALGSWLIYLYIDRYIKAIGFNELRAILLLFIGTNRCGTHFIHEQCSRVCMNSAHMCVWTVFTCTYETVFWALFFLVVIILGNFLMVIILGNF
jgi:hypothetical protein